MAVEVTIKNKSLFKRKLNIKDLILDGIRYGIMDEAFRLEENKIGENTVLFDKQHVCRGFEVSLNNNEIFLRMPLPTSTKDIEFFYNYITKICKKLNTKKFIRENETVFIDQIEEFINFDIETSKNALKQMQTKIESEEMNNMYLFGAVNPICLGKEEIEKINNSPRNLGELLNSIQTKDVYYAKPSIYQKKDESFFGVFVLTSDVPTVLPYIPKLIMPNKEIKVNNWYLCFVVKDQMLGQIAYDDFTSNLKDEDSYDSEHFVINLNEKIIKDYLEKYRTEID